MMDNFDKIFIILNFRFWRVNLVIVMMVIYVNFLINVLINVYIVNCFL